MKLSYKYNQIQLALYDNYLLFLNVNICKSCKDFTNIEIDCFLPLIDANQSKRETKTLIYPEASGPIVADSGNMDC